MGKKKAAQSMREAGAESFLAPEKGSVSAPKSEVIGIQETKISEENLKQIKVKEYEYCYYAPYGITKCAVFDCDRYPPFKIVLENGKTIYLCRPHTKMILNIQI